MRMFVISRMVNFEAGSRFQSKGSLPKILSLMLQLKLHTCVDLFKDRLYIFHFKSVHTSRSCECDVELLLFS